MASNNLVKAPAFNVQYHEFEEKIDFPVELSRAPIWIDGLFEPESTQRVSLGYFENLKRRPETLECLLSIGNGLELYRDKQDFYLAKSLSNAPIYFMSKSSNQQFLITPGVPQYLFSLKPLIHHKVLPKKMGKFYDDYTIKFSFGKPFSNSSYGDIEMVAPCWVQLSLNRMIDLV